MASVPSSRTRPYVEGNWLRNTVFLRPLKNAVTKSPDRTMTYKLVVNSLFVFCMYELLVKSLWLYNCAVYYLYLAGFKIIKWDILKKKKKSVEKEKKDLLPLFNCFPSKKGTKL